MPDFKRILFPVDFSDRCLGAAPFAAAMVARSAGRLVLLHVVENPIARPGELDFGALAFESDVESRTEAARAQLERFARSALPGIDAERVLLTGDPARLIVKQAHELKADLIMMPTHGYGAFRRFILGSVTAKVLHDADVPVWTSAHAEDAERSQAERMESILCAVDLNAAAERALRMAAEFSGASGAKLVVAHAVPSSDALPERFMDREVRQHLIEEARRLLEDRMRSAGVQAELWIGGGQPEEVVKLAAEQFRCDLLFIGRGEHSGLGRLRKHGYAIVRESPCPVISV